MAVYLEVLVRDDGAVLLEDAQDGAALGQVPRLGVDVQVDGAVCGSGIGGDGLPGEVESG